MLPVQELSLKKKKKKKKLREEGDTAELDKVETEETPEGAGAEGKYPWSGSNRDYAYSELLVRIYGILTKHNPQLGGQYRKNVIAPPDIQRESVKKSSF